MGKLTKNQKRKKKVEAKRKSHHSREQRETLAWDRKFKQEIQEARERARELYRQGGMPEEQIKRMLP